MIIVGANVGQTVEGKPLRDGGAAIVADGVVKYALAEERVTKKKAAGGYENALQLGLAELGLEDYDRLYLSSCCQSKQASTSDKVRYVDHHESHAALGFFTSSFNRSLVVVADAGGDVLSQQEVLGKWWNFSRQQLSVYIGSGDRLELLDRQFSSPGACGLGEMYRAFTHFLGWPSGRYAGKTMALAALGRDQTNEGDIFFKFDHKSGKLSLDLNSFAPSEPAGTCRDILRMVGREHLAKAWEQDRDEVARATIAAIAQVNLEFALERLVGYWAEKKGVENICLSGGVALNCTAAQRLSDQTGLNVYVPPAAGDSGQCLGNAIVGTKIETGKLPDLGSFPFLGPNHIVTKSRVEAALKRNSLSASISVFPDLKLLHAKVAEKLFDGAMVFLFRERSEFGPRALGNRSIIANPQSIGIVSKLNELKRRENFNPFAASCIAEDAKYFFSPDDPSPYMTFARKSVPDRSSGFANSVIHFDETCRAQIFDRQFNQQYFDLIKEFRELSGFGMVLNTSLNGPGQPIVETPEQAIDLFSHTDVAEHLVLDDYLISKM